MKQLIRRAVAIFSRWFGNRARRHDALWAASVRQQLLSEARLLVRRIGNHGTSEVLHGFAVGPRFGGPDDAMFDGIVGMSAPPAVPGRGALPRLVLGPAKETLKISRGPHGQAEAELMSVLAPFGT